MHHIPSHIIQPKSLFSHHILTIFSKLNFLIYSPTVHSQTNAVYLCRQPPTAASRQCCCDGGSSPSSGSGVSGGPAGDTICWHSTSAPPCQPSGRLPLRAQHACRPPGPPWFENLKDTGRSWFWFALFPCDICRLAGAGRQELAAGGGPVALAGSKWCELVQRRRPRIPDPCAPYGWRSLVYERRFYVLGLCRWAHRELPVTIRRAARYG
jgi:hypothetical protein